MSSSNLTLSNPAIGALLNRVSCANLGGDAPTEEQLETILQAALRAADHGRLKPTRFISIKGEARNKLGQVFLHSQSNWQQLSPEKQQKLLNAPLRAPLLLVVVNTKQPHPKISQQNQLLASGAAAQNIINAAWALGLGAMWRSGELATNPQVAAALGLGNYESIVGFIYLGERQTEPKPAPKINSSKFLQEWNL